MDTSLARTSQNGQRIASWVGSVMTITTHGQPIPKLHLENDGHNNSRTQTASVAGCVPAGAVCVCENTSDACYRAASAVVPIAAALATPRSLRAVPWAFRFLSPPMYPAAVVAGINPKGWLVDKTRNERNESHGPLAPVTVDCRPCWLLRLHRSNKAIRDRHIAGNGLDCGAYRCTAVAVRNRQNGRVHRLHFGRLTPGDATQKTCIARL